VLEHAAAWLRHLSDTALALFDDQHRSIRAGSFDPARYSGVDNCGSR
jgi:hypothetical protein